MSGFRILVADDHQLMRKAVRALLEGDGGQQVIGEAANGLETVSQVALLSPDLIVLDLAMPGLDGLEAAVRIRQSNPDTRIVLLTATLTPALEARAQAIGIERCLSKSGPPQDLKNAVRDLRSNRAGQMASLLPPRPEEHELDESKAPKEASVSPANR